MRRSMMAAVGLVTIGLVTALPVPMAAADSRVQLVPILGGYTRPVVIAHAPGEGRTMYIAEQTGAIKRATFEDGTWHDDGVFLDLSGLVNDPREPGNNERGLLGLAFHPDYARNGRFYVDYTRRGSGGAHGDSVIAEYRRGSNGRGDPASARTVLVINQPFANHNGGQLIFGPDDDLYIGSGDGGSAGDPRGHGQRRDTLLGKILRIDPLDPDGSGPRRY
jgi:glucose/arabinose dehydrogenase